MNDTEIVKAIAEKVMGWRLNINTVPASTAFWETYSEEEGQVFQDYLTWNPLTNEADCAAVLEKMKALGPVMIDGDEEGWKITFCADKDGSYTPDSIGPDRKRAICLAALKAVDHA